MKTVEAEPPITPATVTAAITTPYTIVAPFPLKGTEEVTITINGQRTRVLIGQAALKKQRR